MCPYWKNVEHVEVENFQSVQHVSQSYLYILLHILDYKSLSRVCNQLSVL